MAPQHSCPGSLGGGVFVSVTGAPALSVVASLPPAWVLDTTRRMDSSYELHILGHQVRERNAMFRLKKLNPSPTAFVDHSATSRTRAKYDAHRFVLVQFAVCKWIRRPAWIQRHQPYVRPVLRSAGFSGCLWGRLRGAGLYPSAAHFVVTYRYYPGT